jgi:predicted transcriptional regulator
VSTSLRSPELLEWGRKAGWVEDAEESMKRQGKGERGREVQTFITSAHMDPSTVQKSIYRGNTYLNTLTNVEAHGM